MKGVSIFLLTVIVLCTVSWYLTNDDINCLITNSEISSVNGFYSAFGGIYLKKTTKLTSVPDVFDLIRVNQFKNLVIDDKTPSIVLKEVWSIFTNYNTVSLYVNKPDKPLDYLNNPPKSGWKTVNGLVDSKMKVKSCKGSLQDSPPAIVKQYNRTNIEQMLGMPVTCCILGLILYIAYYIYEKRIELPVFAYSYDAIVNHGEYYKIITATLSHVDLFHLGFNSMALYQLGLSLEGNYYSSTVFLYSNMYLIFLTILIETAILFVLITRYNQVSMIPQLSIGYSGVLFAWMVAVSVRMNKYCPIFLFPSLCFDTYHIPIPDLISQHASVTTLPVNLGPFVLLIFTKLIIQRSSLLGHLSGILIGYPLAWNLINWLTPPVLICLLSGGYMWHQKLYIFDNHSLNHDSDVNLSDFVEPSILQNYHLLCYCGYAIELLSIVSFMGYVNLIMVRCVVVFLVTYSIMARKRSFTAGSTTSESNFAKIWMCTLVVMLVVVLFDFSTLTALCNNFNLLVGNDFTPGFLTFYIVVLATQVICEVAFIVFLLLNMYCIPATNQYTSLLRLDKAAVEKDLEWLGIMRLWRGAPVAFSGTGNRLSGGSPALSPMTVSSGTGAINSVRSNTSYTHVSQRSGSPSVSRSGTINV